MEFIFTGTGTSQGVPVIGCDCEVCQSADPKDSRLRTSGLLRSEQTSLVFDTGPDFRQQMLRQEIRSLDGVVFTHPHKDHVAGLDDVRAFNFLQRRPMPVFANALTLSHLKREFAYVFEAAGYPGLPQLLLHEIGEAAFAVGDIELQPLPVMHAKMPVLGFRVEKFAYITDANYLPASSLEKLQGVDILVLNALRKEAHHSHFTLDEAIALSRKVGAKQTYLLHISHQMGKHEAVSRELPAGVQLAYDGLKISW